MFTNRIIPNVYVIFRHEPHVPCHGSVGALDGGSPMLMPVEFKKW